MERVWLWEDLKSWEQPLWDAIGDVVSRSVVQRFEKIRLSIWLATTSAGWTIGCTMSVDNMLTLNCCARGAFRPYLKASERIMAREPQTLGSSTLKVCCHWMRSASKSARGRFFLTPEFPELTREGVDKAITSVGRDLRHGSLFFDLHKRELVECGSHYMLYGSEYVTAIAAHIEGPRDYRQALKHFGVPTLFVCNVPFSLMHPGAIADFAGQAIRVLFERVMDKAITILRLAKAVVLLSSPPWHPNLSLVIHIRSFSRIRSLTIVRFGRPNEEI